MIARSTFSNVASRLKTLAMQVGQHQDQVKTLKEVSRVKRILCAGATARRVDLVSRTRPAMGKARVRVRAKHGVMGQRRVGKTEVALKLAPQIRHARMGFNKRADRAKAGPTEEILLPGRIAAVADGKRTMGQRSRSKAARRETGVQTETEGAPRPCAVGRTVKG